MGRYAGFLERPAERPVSFSDVDAARAKAIIGAAREAEQTLLPADPAGEFLSCYRIPAVPCRTAGTVDECVAAGDELGYPVVLKVDAESVVHKTESGGVVLDIRDRDALREQAQALASRFADVEPRYLLQRYSSAGREVIVGAKAVPGLGHVIMFGLGGIYVEVLQDVSFKIAPVSAREAEEMIASLRAYPLLTGVRGQAGVDLEALVEILQRVSQMLVDNPEIRELDLNPVFALQRGAQVADARVML